MTSLAIYFTGFIAAFLFIVISYYKWAFTYWHKWDIPTLSPKIPFGDLENLFTRKTSRILELRKLYNKIKKLGKLFDLRYVKINIDFVLIGYTLRQAAA